MLFRVDFSRPFRTNLVQYFAFWIDSFVKQAEILALYEWIRVWVGISCSLANTFVNDSVIALSFL